MASLRDSRVAQFFAERFPLEKFSLRSLVQHKEVPVHRMSWAYYLGGLALFCFIIQLVTGLALLFYYEPTVSDAHASVEFITHNVSAGALIRNLHTWTSSAMIFFVLAHLITTFAMKAFDKPREITWISGVVLVMLTFGFGFTGYLLPWHQIAVNATKVGLQSIESVGQYLPGEMSTWPHRFRDLIQGGETIGQATLSRFYAIHVVILPLLVCALLGFHLMSVQLQGMSQGVDKVTGKTERFFPFFVLKDFSLWGVVFFVLFVLALCLPFESFMSFPLFQPFDPMGSTPQGIKPEWYFFFIYYPLELLPFWVVMLGTTLAVTGLFLSPWLFRASTRRALGFLACAVALYMVIITVFGHDIYVLFKGGHQ